MKFNPDDENTNITKTDIEQINIEIDENIVKKLLSNHDLQEGVDKLIEFSKSDKLEELNCRE